MEKADVVSEKKRSKVDLGFNLTHYGQMALRIDTEGNLAALDKRAKDGARSAASITFLGTVDSYANDYTQDDV
jgi:hypothetical protein